VTVPRMSDHETEKTMVGIRMGTRRD